MSDSSPHAEPITSAPAAALQNDLTAAVRRCSLCGIELGGIVSFVNDKCSGCFFANAQGGNPDDWKAPNQRVTYDVNFNQGTDVALKYDDGKLPLDLLPFEALEDIALVLEHGAKKYEAHNWRAGFIWSRTFAACLRHLFAFWRGEDIDPDSGLPHLSHAGCNILFLISFFKTKTGKDNRYAKASS